MRTRTGIAPQPYEASRAWSRTSSHTAAGSATQKKGAEPLGLARGVAVYPEITRRKVRIPLSRTPAAGEKLEVTFTDDDTSPGKVLAKAAL